MKKKVVTMLLVVAMAFSATACGDADSAKEPGNSNVAQTDKTSNEAEEKEVKVEIPTEVEIAGTVYSTEATELHIMDAELNEKDIENIGYMKNLTDFWLIRTTGLDNINFVANLANLKEFNMQSCDVSDISSLAELTQLEEVTLYANQITDYTPLSNLTNLRWLEIEESGISNISFVSNLTNLTFLDLRGNQITDISAVVGLSKLEYLYLGDNENLSDISALKDLQSLIQVDVLYTNVSDLSPLYGLSNLTKVYIEGTVVSDESIEEFKTMMPDCQREYNY